MTTRTRQTRTDTLIADPDALCAALAECNERQRRLMAASVALNIGKCGISAVYRVTGIARTTIYAGIKELKNGSPVESGRCRTPGGGRKTVEANQPGIDAALIDIVKKRTVGDPQSDAKWVSNSSRNLAKELGENGFQATHSTVCHMLKKTSTH